MRQIAKVVVDIPVMQTNKPFDYAVPTALASQLQKGMRVEVPFGPRHIQGFIVDLVSHPSYDGTLKEIIRPLDAEPVLTEELLQLGEKMAQTVFSYRIHCYLTMLPPVMRAKYEKEFVLVEGEQDSSVKELFGTSDAIGFDEAYERGILPNLLAYRKQGLVEVHYLVKNKAKAKMQKGYRNEITLDDVKEIFASLSKSAKKQRILLEVLAERPGETFLMTEFQEQYDLSVAVVQAGVQKGWLTVVEREQYRDPLKNLNVNQTTELQLNEAQQSAHQQVKRAMDQANHEVFLLKGVTGSGKTEVYLQLIRDVLNKGETALMLVPEISLTPQMVRHFKGRFGDQVAVMHSGLSNGEKYDEWRKIHRGEARVVVGARSSIFSPVENLGIIIIDEEHESSYKQEENPKYHARSMAIERGKYNNCPVVLGSATPSLESRARAQKGVFTLLELPERANQKGLPDVSIVDMREEFQDNNRSSFSRMLLHKLEERIQKGEQTVLLLNRRGYSSFLLCRDCGCVLECPNCDISLTFHMDHKEMKCHYCGHREPVPHHCPKCSSRSFRYFGTGTQKIEEELKSILPHARVIRMDVDTTRKKGAHEKLLAAFGRKEADVLLGTQMIAKGLDFPSVTLVGVINADTSLHLPDFRASEKTFQLLTQVSGRAGRADLPGEVIIQSFNPEHYAIQYAKLHHYDGFYGQEMHLRHQSGYPPYFFTTQITVSDLDEQKAQKKIYDISAFLRSNLHPTTIILGPSKGSIAKMNNRYYFQLIMKYKNEPKLQQTLQSLLDGSQKDIAKGMYVSIDTDPVNFF